MGLHQPPLGPLDLALCAREILFLAGPSGSGKSRLLRVLADLDPPAYGEIHIDGHPQWTYPPSLYRRQVAYLSPHPNLGPGTVRTLIGRVRSLSTWQGSAFPDLALERLGLSQALLDRPASELSTGETVRVALALLLAGRAPILLLDEPTAALDPTSKGMVEALLQERSRAGASILWVSHDPDQTAHLADGLLVLEKGKLIGPDRQNDRFAQRLRVTKTD